MEEENRGVGERIEVQIGHLRLKLVLSSSDSVNVTLFNPITHQQSIPHLISLSSSSLTSTTENLKVILFFKYFLIFFNYSYFTLYLF